MILATHEAIGRTLMGQVAQQLQDSLSASEPKADPQVCLLLQLAQLLGLDWPEVAGVVEPPAQYRRGHTFVPW